MAFKIGGVLKPSESVMASLATVGVVYGVYSYNLPSVTEVHGAMPHNINVSSSRKKAAISAAAAAGALFLLSRDPNVFMAGAATFVVLDWSYRHANAVHPETGKLIPRMDMSQAAASYYDASDDTSDGPSTYDG